MRDNFIKWYPFCIVDISIASSFVPPPPSPEIYVVFLKTLKSFFYYKQH